MTTSADRILSTGLQAHASGTPLPWALAGAVDEEVRLRHSVAGLRRAGLSPWSLWYLRLRGTAGAQRDRVLDDCFRWAVLSDAARSTDFVRGVAGHIARNLDSVTAVERALDDVSVTVLDQRWCARAHELYSPEQVLPFLRPYLAWGEPTIAQRLRSLAAWVHAHVTWVSDERKWHAADYWQAPAQTLSQGTGDCEDQALVLWSAMPLLGLPTGELVIGTLEGRGHAWVEVPELPLPLIAEATNGGVYLRGAARGYVAATRIAPTRCYRA